MLPFAGLMTFTIYWGGGGHGRNTISLGVNRGKWTQGVPETGIVSGVGETQRFWNPATHQAAC